jgi:transglutaminase-like putative cysteine protease
MSTIAVEHETSYDYEELVQQAHHLAYLSPCNNFYQRVLSHQLEIDPTPDRHLVNADVFGNQRDFFSYHHPHQKLMVKSQCLVQTHGLSLERALQDDLPWRELKERLEYSAGKVYLPAGEHIYPSPYAPFVEEIQRYTREIFEETPLLIAATRELCTRIHGDFEYSPAATEVDTPVSRAFRLRQGVCQDFAHIMIVGLRSMGLAARYVSGYLLTKPPPGQQKLRGSDASHAWVSVYCPGVADDWVEFDPTNDLVAGEGHVRLAYGRDFGDVSPLRGVIRGGGEHQLTIAVTAEESAESSF